MKWTKLMIKTTSEAEDIIISTMYDLGLEGAQIEDKVPLTAWEKEQMFVDILPDGPADDGVAYLSFFVEVPEEGDEKPQLPQGLDGAADNSPGKIVTFANKVTFPERRSPSRSFSVVCLSAIIFSSLHFVFPFT